MVGIIDEIDAELFFSEQNRTIYNAMASICRAGDAPTISNVAARVTAEQHLPTGADEVVKAHTLNLMGVMRRSVGSQYLPRLIQKLRDLAFRRHLIHISITASQRAYDYSESAAAIFDDIMARIDAVAGHGGSEHSIRKLSVLHVEVLQRMEDMRNSGGIIGTSTGIKDLDRIIFGLRGKHMVLVAGRPGMGKTALACTLAYNAAKSGDPCLVFSLEMNASEFTQRLQTIHYQIPNDQIQTGDISPSNRAAMASDKVFSSLPIYIDDTPGISIHTMRSKIRRMVRSHGVKHVLVDYLQLITGANPDVSEMTRSQQLGYISNSLKAIAKSLDITIIPLAQLSRSVESRGGSKIPMLSDLRESGDMEQDADTVIFCYRPEYYGFAETDSGLSTAGLGSLIVAKHRHGSIGNALCRYIGPYTLWVDHDSPIQGPYVPTLPPLPPAPYKKRVSREEQSYPVKSTSTLFSDSQANGLLPDPGTDHGPEDDVPF